MISLIGISHNFFDFHSVAFVLSIHIFFNFSVSFSVLSTIYNIFYAALTEFLNIIDGNFTSILSYTSDQIVYLEQAWAYSFHGIWAPAIFIGASGASMVAIYAIFDIAGAGHVVEESI